MTDLSMLNAFKELFILIPNHHSLINKSKINKMLSEPGAEYIQHKMDAIEAYKKG